MKRLQAQIRITHQRLPHNIRTVVQVRVQLLLRVPEKPGLARLVVVAVRELPQDLDAVQVVEDAQVGAVAAAERGRVGDGVAGGGDFVGGAGVDAKGRV